MNKQVTIYCASSPKVPKIYFDAAEELTRLLVEADYGIRYGGGAKGLMGIIADTVLACGGKITGVIPRFMIDVEWEHKGVIEMIHVNTMHQRKELLIENTHAVIALPGGIGTLEELFEVMSWKKLGQFPHPIILLNTNGYYDPLIEMSNRMVDESFMRPEHGHIWKVVSEPRDVIPTILDTELWGPQVINFASV
jgi:uncharacterized protein (TIGR00730 family)